MSEHHAAPEPPPTADEIAEACLYRAGLAAPADGAGPRLTPLLTALGEPPPRRRADEPARVAGGLVAAAIEVLDGVPGLPAELRQAAVGGIAERVCAALLKIETARPAGGERRGGDLTAAMASIDSLIEEGSPGACFGILYLEVEPNRSISRLPAADYGAVHAEISGALRRRLRPNDLLFAVGGYAWILLLPGLISPAQLTLAAAKLVRGFDETRWSWCGESLPIRPSMGGAFYPDSGSDAHALVQTARLARFEAWRGGEPFALGSGAEAGDEAHLTALVRDIEGALASDQLALFVQPQIDIASGACVSAEALLRWHRGDGNWVAPPLIVAAIERAGLRSQFNRWLIQRALRHLSELGEAGVAVKLGINLVAEDAQDGELPEMVRQALAIWDIDPACLVLEMTEGAMVAETQEVIDNLNRLKAYGVGLSIDDFGTGYSAMAYLRRLPVGELKVDQVFVRRMLDSDKDREIVASIIGLAHQLGMEVVAEGVEDVRMLECLRELGCDRAQGYLYSRPMRLGEFRDWWHRHRALTAGAA